MATLMNDMAISPLSEALGAEVTGINAANLEPATFDALRDAFHDNIVLVIRDQHLTPAEQTAFAKRFGDIQYHINKEYMMPGQPEVLILSTEIKDGKNVGVPDAGSDWHSDHSYVDQPTGYTILQSVTVPKVGGDTEWSNMYLAYETLPEETKQRIEGLRGVHVFDRRKNPRTRVDAQYAANPDAVYGLPIPDATHPMVRTHAQTGRKSLFVSPRFVVGIEGMDDVEAQPLLDELFEHQVRLEFRYRHKWRKGDLLMWDNSCLIHIGRGNIKPPGIRHMHRTMVLGDRPH